ncbi:transposase, partial [Streptomyces ipomoeae]|uniref:transposase n=1 Tax=Streptomyces ipomoeae TaxID=103232 RepID=UPI0038D4454A
MGGPPVAPSRRNGILAPARPQDALGRLATSFLGCVSYVDLDVSRSHFVGRHDLTNTQWAKLEPLLPVGKKPGRPPVHTKRQLIDGIRWLRGHEVSGQAPNRVVLNKETRKKWRHPVSTRRS